MENKFTPINLTLGSLFVALTAIGANITSIIPGLSVGGVPITLQTFFAVLAGLVLGSRLGAFTMFVYMMLGLVGAPVFRSEERRVGKGGGSGEGAEAVTM